jgi:hypothetical protein
MQRLADGCAIFATALLIGRWLLPMHPLELLEQTLLHSCRYAPFAAHVVLCDGRRGSLVATRLLSGGRCDRNQHCSRSRLASMGGARLLASATGACAAIHVALQHGDGRLASVHRRTGTAWGDTACCS